MHPYDLIDRQTLQAVSGSSMSAVQLQAAARVAFIKMHICITDSNFI